MSDAFKEQEGVKAIPPVGDEGVIQSDSQEPLKMIRSLERTFDYAILLDQDEVKAILSRTGEGFLIEFEEEGEDGQFYSTGFLNQPDVLELLKNLKVESIEGEDPESLTSAMLPFSREFEINIPVSVLSSVRGQFTGEDLKEDVVEGESGMTPIDIEYMKEQEKFAE